MSSSDTDSDSDSGPDGPQSASAVPAGAARHKKSKYRSPQENIDRFWSKFMTKTPGRVTAIIPSNEFGEKRKAKGAAKPRAAAHAGQTGLNSYEEAAAICKAKVAQIVKECRRVNQKYRDPHFDLEFDLKLGRRDCLDSLDNRKDKNKKKEPDNRDKGNRADVKNGKNKIPVHSATWPAAAAAASSSCAPAESRGGPSHIHGEDDETFYPRAVKRVTDIFENPQFYVDGPTANDVRQGRDGDCWLMAALCTMSNKPGLIERVCVAQDQAVGVYGFVFHRDGQFFSEIIDDKLYLTKPDYDEGFLERILWDDRERVNSEENYRKTYQTNSGALYFAQCENPNETWLPLLEKAYAKAHGDYSAIEGGFTGEGLEDLTGGVTSEIYTTDILDKEDFWNKELMQVNKTFLFGCSTGVWGRGWGERKGIVELHAYSVMRAVEIDGKRLVLLKNPWGKGEWTGPWSDGSKEWTPEWLRKLDHRFGDDGSFWIEYSDLLQKYQAFDRTRLFDTKEWGAAVAWASFPVPWATTTAALGYSRTKFRVELRRSGPVVIVLSQLDERYFVGLEGQYRFELSFRVHRFPISGGAAEVAGSGAADDDDDDDDDDDYIVRSRTAYRMNRSVNVELDLDAGEYTVLVKIEAQRNDEVMPPEEVVRANAKTRREKLLRVGLAYDLAHAKARLTPEEEAEEEAMRKAYVQRKKDKERQKIREEVMQGRRREHYLDTRDLIKKRKRAEKSKAKKEAKKEKKRLEAEKRKAEEEKCESPAEEASKTDVEDHQNATRGEEVSEKKEPAADQQTQASDDKPEAKPTTETETSAEQSKDKSEPLPDPSAKVEPRSAAESTTDESTGSAILTPATPQVEPKDEVPDVTEELNNDTQTEPPTTPPAHGHSEHPAATPETVAASPTAATPPKAPSPQDRPSRADKGVQVPDRPPPPRARSPDHHSHHRRHDRSPPRRPPLMNSPFPPRHMMRPSMHSLSPMGGGGRWSPPPPPPPLSPPAADNDSSDTDSDLESISSVSDLSDRELDIVVDNRKRMQAAQMAGPGGVAPAQPAAPAPPGAAGSASDGEDDGKDPWNAVAVIGLRVYYRVSAEEKEGARIKVVRPNKYPVSGGEGGEAKGKGADKADGEDVLDVDDSAKDATLEGVALEKGGEHTALEREAHKEMEKEEQAEEKNEKQAEEGMEEKQPQVEQKDGKLEGGEKKDEKSETEKDAGEVKTDDG
ncbi:uncharacterized protein E0L32_006272 [Thyridium curvatum]|uniref:Calpain catalytic domain-containing protein n=1 Tax=Thyridium curvatum TaxID=1093900 RepID=A0A507B7B5_9PEZI|nr:uncharacterized protein E0L32_006272 [Thyridium curvatum]TPX13299.1 hypothetical protein E0L32_006272 [Thyridium curvatum]